MRLLKILGVLFLILVITSTSYYFYQYSVREGKRIETLIPSEPLFVIKLKPRPADLRSLRDDPTMQMLASIQSDAKIADRMDALRELLATDNKVFQMVHKNPLHISAHVSGSNSIDLLYSIQLGKNDQWLISYLDKVIDGNRSERNHENRKIYEYQIGGQLFAVFSEDGIAAASFAPILVEQFVRNLNQDRPSKAPLLKNGFTSSLKLYSDLANLRNVQRFLFDDELLDFNAYCMAGIDCGEGMFVMDGLFFPDSIKTAELLSGVHFDPSTFDQVFPSNSALVNINALNSFVESGKVLLSKSGAVYEIDKLTDLDNTFLPLVVDIVLRPIDVNYQRSAYKLLRFADKKSMQVNFLKDTDMDVTTKNSSYSLYSIDAKEIDLVSALIDDDTRQYNYALIINDVMIFGKSRDALSAYADASAFGSLNFNKIAADLKMPEQQWSQYTYINFDNAKYIFKSVLKPLYYQKYLKLKRENGGPVDLISAVYRQGSDLRFEIRSGGNKSEGTGFNTALSVALDDLVQSSATCKYDGSSNTYLIQDEEFKLYAIKSDGSLNFKYDARSMILSDIEEIDYFENGNSQFLFNTATSIFLIDKDGNDVGNYPIGLPDTARASLTLIDHSSMREQMIFIPCANRVYAYTLNGRRSGDFKFLASAEKIVGGLAHFHKDKKNYIVFKDIDGFAYIIDVRGNLIAKSEQYDFSSGNDFQPFQIAEEIAILGSDVNGNILSMNIDASVKTISSNVFGSDHYFKVVDLDDDRIPEYVFVENNELSVYTSDMILVLLQTFDQNLDHWIDIIETEPGTFKIACSSTLNSEIYLIDIEGEYHSGFPLQGSKGFDISLSVDKKESVLVTGFGRFLKVYSFN